MNIRKFLVSAIAVGALASTTLLQAQEQKKGKGGGGRGGMGSPEQMVQRLDEAVQLTAEQKTKITAIYAKSREKMQALPEDQRMEKGREIMASIRTEVRAVLTAEQQKKFDEMTPGRGQGGQGKKKNQ